ncbi:hypothetical protein KYT87_09575 [Achromobacter sp. ES-001]|uniref:hypothetical protein n=1 Tax=Achromobacter sp. ES-001 TaxID=2860286 RepID=UPI001C63FDE5|nr:hypothetical protein [Achromobacter sp. ES-001]QYJ23444.1 hypothetical protein KYT87_09575 [Achromobacter sp. ES-001]
MNLSEIIKTGIEPALALLPAKMDTPAARVMLLAIGLQESRFIHRRQINGPARGFWQFERGGGVVGVLTHSASAALARQVCEARGVTPTAPAVYAQLESDDVLAAAFARLLLWTDPGRLPAVGDSKGGWDLYARTWRPGKPHQQTWSDLHAQAVAEVAP